MPRVTASAKKAGGVDKVQVDLSSKKVTIVYDPTKTTRQAIADAIRKGGDTISSEQFSPSK